MEGTNDVLEPVRMPYSLRGFRPQSQRLVSLSPPLILPHGNGLKINKDVLIDQLQSVVEGGEPRFFTAPATMRPDSASETSARSNPGGASDH